MPSSWKTAKNILKGKAKGAKLMILGVFLVSIGVSGTLVNRENWGTFSVFTMLGTISFVRGLDLYSVEAKRELEKESPKS
jgi:hypothetical protein